MSGFEAAFSPIKKNVALILRCFQNLQQSRGGCGTGPVVERHRDVGQIDAYLGVGCRFCPSGCRGRGGVDILGIDCLSAQTGNKKGSRSEMHRPTKID